MKKHRKLKIFLCAVAAVAVIAAGYFLISSWLSGRPALDYAYNAVPSVPAEYPDVSFAVISDLHVYDTSLGTEGAAFEATMNADRKLLLDSVDLLDYAIDDILRSDAQFVLVPGDLTKDGERVCHDIVAERLSRLTIAGLKVFVVPGNHDVQNPDAVSYSGDATHPVENITPEEFANIYAAFGYADAIERDEGSLSYVAEPVDGLWILGIDACRYRENRPGVEEIVGGKVSQETADWLADVMGRAAAGGKAVVALMHHGVVEHWEGQGKLHPDYLIEDYRHFGEFLASYDVRLVFTGHYHAQDVTRGVFGDKSIYDVETGALITAPCFIRYASIRDGFLSLRSETAADKLYPGTSFASDALAFVKRTVVLEAFSTLKSYKVSDADADIIADAVGDAFTAHYSGDEDPEKRPALDKSRLGLWGRIVLMTQKYVLDGLWNDLEPADSDITVSLR